MTWTNGDTLVVSGGLCEGLGIVLVAFPAVKKFWASSIEQAGRTSKKFAVGLARWVSHFIPRRFRRKHIVSETIALTLGMPTVSVQVSVTFGWNREQPIEAQIEQVRTNIGRLQKELQDLPERVRGDLLPDIQKESTRITDEKMLPLEERLEFVEKDVARHPVVRGFGVVMLLIGVGLTVWGSVLGS